MRKIKNFFNEETFNYKDIILLGIIVVGYTILSFINFGTKKSPQTFYEINNTNGIKITLPEIIDVNKIVFFNGRHSGNYIIMLSTDDKEYSSDLMMKGSGAFSWDIGKLNQQAKYVKLIPKESTLTMGEIAFYDNGNNKLQISITTNGNSISELTDEPSTIPENKNSVNSSYFDEVYFARSAYEYAAGLKVYDWVHPPLGKLIQSIPIKLSKKMAPFYYRLTSNIAGILMIIVMYLFGKEMFKKRKYATLAALLMTFDTLHFAQTRIGTIDSILALFILLSYFHMYRYIKYSKTYDIGLSGLYFGLSACVKWSGLWAGLGLCIIYVINKIVQKQKLSDFIFNGLVFFIIIPTFIYASSYLIYPHLNSREVDSIEQIVKQTKQTYEYHRDLKADHPFTSKWYTWPISYKPVWYYTNDISPNSRQTIVGVGNILIWWPAILTFLLLPYYIIKKKNKKSLFLLITIASIYIPYIFIGRVMFLYHYFIILPFMMMTIVNFFYQFNKNNKKDIFIVLYTVLVIATFIIYYPVVSGMTVTKDYIESTKILSSWEY